MTDTSRVPPDVDGHPTLAVRVRVSIRMLIPTGKRKEARRILAAMIGRIRLEEGCLSCRLYQEAMGTKSLMFEEIWANEKRLKKHLRSEEFRNVLLVVEMASRPPEIRFDRIAQSTGIETIEDVRKRADTLPGANGLTG
jgi:quinol monooxygenase YgiN